ncbi:zinc ribbon domain-containing protein [Fischerella sp. PCC 9605]|uniref:zinc ribbon domain-containing protein n=1 Tax=Fischerella sp. PCC 9605 TaxID=1173024 RepID=UPI00047A6914|nr:zinc ribbon domain-containing protein [Fischerella sp. PCC 9605]
MTANKTRGSLALVQHLLHGIVYCGECGHKMVVQYKGATRYICNSLRQQYRGALFVSIFLLMQIDEYVVNCFFRSFVSCRARCLSQSCQNPTAVSRDSGTSALSPIQRLQYQVALAERQFNRVDPDNRLVAAELEQRWENALRELKLAQENYAQRQQPQHSRSPTKRTQNCFY